MSIIKKVVFIGSKALGLDVLRIIWELRPETLTAVVTFDDRADQRSVFPKFLAFGNEIGVPVHIADNPRRAEEFISSVSPDMCLVVCWYWLFSEEFIRRIPFGAIGVHNSLLPKYRGGSPLVWALINGEVESGFSLFSLAKEMDAGDVWLQGKVAIPRQDTIADALNSVQKELFKALEGKWCALLDGNLSPSAQQHEEATYCAQRFPEDGRIDWRWPAERVFNFIRALSPPYPGAFSYYQGKKVTIIGADLFDRPYYGTPSQVARVGEDGVFVICGDHRAIIIRAVLVEGVQQVARLVFPSIKIRLEG